ncbi:hypothetical protein [Flavihumibacter sp. CACIAM 22H1]|uniref:hypothetical protein n=1 Tax=Flavihumibacter sp. CACIAM 22H1 TaxID=1812911 RepID=UPI0007A8A737|nr:hypothetical protein [Flavihumibacter sp. CACIAM 22H1]KYP14036.1 MAG: hypothetical protein A1D16_04185 [Flavihumibacter sp. CACIAM 22H1]
MWNKLFIQLKSRNKILFYVGSISLLGALICGLLSVWSPLEVGGIPAFIKPMKFYLALTAAVYTMGWLMVYLQNQQAVKRYSWVVVVTMTVELGIITLQAALGQASHFNISSWPNALLYQLMGVAILIYTFWTAYIGYLFFKQKNFPLWMTPGYIWGIRLGILFFVTAALQGGHMAMLMQHSIGGADGGEGYPLLNWSSLHGDLRVVHFFGIHSLQLFPLLGYYLVPTKRSMVAIALSWLFFLVLLYAQAMKGYPLIG